MSYKLSKALYWAAIVVTALLAVAALMTQKRWIGVVALLVLLAGSVQTVFFYKCPHCGKAMEIRGKGNGKCPYCGKPLQ